MQADNEDFELKQMRDMAAAKKRWDALVCFEIQRERDRLAFLMLLIVMLCVAFRYVTVINLEF